MAVTEVTQGVYHKLIGTNPSKVSFTGMDVARLPVEMVSWNDATEFCSRLSETENFQPFYARYGDRMTPLDGNGYRLPTEAEWEFACRAGTTSTYSIADLNLGQAAWFDGTSAGRTHPVGELKANPFGLYDVHGNLWEWVQDWWEPTYYQQFQSQPALDPTGPTDGPIRVARGGSFREFESYSRSAIRLGDSPVKGFDRIGFRVSLTVNAVRQALKLTDPAMSNRPKASVTDASTSSTAKSRAPLPPLDLDETDPLPGWELPPGAPPPVVAPCEPTLAKERQQQWAKFLKRPVIEELDIAAFRKARPDVQLNIDGKEYPATLTNDSK